MFNYNPTIESTGKTEIIENIMNSFSTMYLTMISIVQGVALSLFVLKVPKIMAWTCIFTLTWTWESFIITLSTVAYIVTTFLFIVLTWHSYFWLAAIARWVPTIWDSILFFVLGAFELMLIDSLSHLNSFAWFYLFASIGIISGIQYKYNSSRLDDTKVKTLTNNVLIINLWQEDDKRLGVHIAKYKSDRAKKLWLKSSIFIAILIILNWVVPNSYLSCLVASVPILKYIKLAFILSIFNCAYTSDF